MANYVQVSAQISEATRQRLDQYARESGIKKSHIIEDAIEQHLDVLDEIPPQYVIPKHIVLANESFDQVVEMINNPRKPTPALVELMRTSRLHRDNP